MATEALAIFSAFLFLYIIGKVYNVTSFARYHPGGNKQLMRGAGKDCTALFDKVGTFLCVSVIHVDQAQKVEFGCMKQVSPHPMLSALDH